MVDVTRFAGLYDLKEIIAIQMKAIFMHNEMANQIKSRLKNFAETDAPFAWQTIVNGIWPATRAK